MARARIGNHQHVAGRLFVARRQIELNHAVRTEDVGTTTPVPAQDLPIRPVGEDGTGQIPGAAMPGDRQDRGGDRGQGPMSGDDAGKGEQSAPQ
jgi:hypothetical protein